MRVGSYVYDNPSDESDDRLIAFGAVPPFVYSEVMGDLKRIAGQSGRGRRGCGRGLSLGPIRQRHRLANHGPGVHYLPGMR